MSVLAEEVHVYNVGPYAYVAVLRKSLCTLCSLIGTIMLLLSLCWADISVQHCHSNYGWDRGGHFISF